MPDDATYESRESAYLRKENWPECIPNCGPKREYGPYPWPPLTHDGAGVDDYPDLHVDAQSIGAMYHGEVCPWCGVPLQGDEQVVTLEEEAGKLNDVSPVRDPATAYHPDCWNTRKRLLHEQRGETLTAFTVRGDDA